MATLSSWEIDYYETAAGSVPVAEFVEQLAPQTQAKFIRSLELLEEYGLLLREPWVKNIHGIPKLRELRFTSFGEIYRCFSFPCPEESSFYFMDSRRSPRKPRNANCKQPKLE